MGAAARLRVLKIPDGEFQVQRIKLPQGLGKCEDRASWCESRGGHGCEQLQSLRSPLPSHVVTALSVIWSWQGLQRRGGWERWTEGQRGSGEVFGLSPFLHMLPVLNKPKRELTVVQHAGSSALQEMSASITERL